MASPYDVFVFSHTIDTMVAKKVNADRGNLMLGMKQLENDPENVKAQLSLRGEVTGIDELLELLAKRRQSIATLQAAISPFFDISE